MSDRAPIPPSAAREAEPFLPDDWRELEPLVDTVLDTPSDRRADVLTELSAGNANRRAALERLVAECERDVPLFDRPAAERFDRLLGEHVEVPLPETLGARYRIEREVGRGGMARVYLARDLKHSRDVAVKVIRPELAASLGRERFLGEIAIAARLRHPNIVPLYDSGDADGVLYFVMPYEEGLSLRTRLAEGGPLPVAECVSTLRDVARALAYAHEHGVVHRDVKPDNVMQSGGAAVVTDFGIAKAISAAQADVPSDVPTGTGVRSTAIGTPAYMAPEQASGDPSTDHRADIYSFGCLAYELFTGHAPFGDQPTRLLGTAHAETVPALVTVVRPDVPASVATLVAQCLEKDPAARPQSARDVLNALEGAATTASAPGSPPREARPFRWVGLVLAAGLIGAVVYLTTRSPELSAPLTLAVLPFDNVGADSTTDFLAQGLADDVAGALARVPGILVKSRIGARSYQGKSVDVTEAGARLEADYLMTGKVRQERGRWIVSGNLTRAADSTIVWGEAFNLSLDQQAEAAEVIAASLVAGLRSRFPKSIGSTPILASNQRTSDPAAKRLYMEGNERLNRRRQSVMESVGLFKKAIEKDTFYAEAYSGLSMALSFIPNYHAIPPRDIQPDLVKAAHRALELDSTLAQPHVALAKAYEFDWQWDSAETEFRTAIRLDGHLAEARSQYARHLRNRGRFPEALGQLRAARAEDPVSAPIVSQLMYAYYLDHQLDSALAESNRALANDPANRTTVALGALVRLAMGLPDSARKLIDRASPTTPFIAYVIARSGDTATARQRLRTEDAETPQPGLANTRRTYTYLGLGDTARALSALERATDAREVWPSTLSVYDPLYDSIRQTARFQALLRRVGLVPR